MAFTHLAYTFNSDQFHTDLKSKIFNGNELDLVKLRELAGTALSQATERERRILINLRCDETCLEDPDGDMSPSYLWYTICNVAWFNDCPSLSNNRFRGSHTVLEGVLSMIGWDQREVYDLLFGTRIERAIDKPEFQIFVDTLSFYAGCLNTNQANDVLTHLRQSYDAFMSTEVQQPLIEYLKLNRLSISDGLSFAYADALDMLETAVSRGEWLYLIRE